MALCPYAHPHPHLYHRPPRLALARPGRGRNPRQAPAHRRRLLRRRPQGPAQAPQDPGQPVVRAPPPPHHERHPRPLEERRHALSRRHHGRELLRVRAGHRHLRRPPDRQVRVGQQLHRLRHRPRPRPGALRLPGPRHGPRELARPHPAHDHLEPPAARLRALGGGGHHHHGGQPGAHADLLRLGALALAAGEQAHPLSRLRRDRQVPVRRRLARGGPRQPGREARPHLPGQPPHLEDQLAHDPLRLHLAGLDRGVPGALRLLRALPVLRRLPDHAVSPHPLARGPARSGGRGERAACLVRVRGLPGALGRRGPQPRRARRRVARGRERP